ncbi:hypothetical protein [Pseudovibrio ascidiaceicola]|uniref:hypothetical protein n=1 Tax=Pseudovibrio ascidiaceicola TaxID=285279 RepID=UPI00135CD052|nr:hypothetical protein [Pseudovibrio ascidiaceicola]
MAGWIRVDRALFEHEALESPWEWGCWCWLVSQAAWRETSVSRRAKKIDLSIGQLSFSLRFLAEKWGCSVGKTRRLLKKFEKWHMVEIECSTGENLITICNYSKFQSGEAASETVTEHKRAQGRNGDGTVTSTKKNKITNKQDNKKQDSESTDVDSFVASAPDYVRESYDFYCKSVEEYNASKATGVLPLPKPTKLSDKRRREFTRALKDLPKGRTFAEVVAKAGRCPFLLGENDQGWVIHLDFILQKGKFQEILDGNYPERPAASAPGVRRGQRVAGADLFTES